MTEVLLIYVIPRGRQNPRRQDGARRAGATDRLRGERNQPLCEVPDGREAVSRQKLVAPAQSRLAEDVGGDGGGEESAQ